MFDRWPLTRLFVLMTRLFFLMARLGCLTVLLRFFFKEFLSFLEWYHFRRCLYLRFRRYVLGSSSTAIRALLVPLKQHLGARGFWRCFRYVWLLGCLAFDTTPLVTLLEQNDKWQTNKKILQKNRCVCVCVWCCATCDAIRIKARDSKQW